MALHFVRTIDKSPHMFSLADEADNDWLLYCGGWRVGRVHKPGGLKQGTFAWSLTGPHTPEASLPVRPLLLSGRRVSGRGGFALAARGRSKAGVL